MYIYINIKLLWEWLGTNPTTWYEKNMLSKDLMPKANKSESLGKDPIVSYEFDEDEVKHDPFEFPNDNNILFSRLLSNSLVW